MPPAETETQVSEQQLQDSLDRLGASALDWRARAERYETALMLIAANKSKTLISVEHGRRYSIGANAAFEVCASYADAALAQAGGEADAGKGRGADRMILAYENVNVMAPLVSALVAECGEGEFVIFRRPFRWMRGTWEDHRVIENAYEMFDLEQVLSERGWEARYTFKHAAIAKPAAPSPSGDRQKEGDASPPEDKG